MVEHSWTACIFTETASWMNDLSHLREKKAPNIFFPSDLFLPKIAVQPEISKFLSFVLVNNLRSELQKLSVTGS